MVAKLASCVVFTGERVNPLTLGARAAKSYESNSQIHTAFDVKLLDNAFQSFT